MILTTSCDRCSCTFRIFMTPEESHLLDQLEKDGLAECPRLCGGSIQVKTSSDISSLKEPLTLSLRELYQAVNGYGLPDEIQTDPVVVESLLKSSKVVSVSTELSGKRVILNSLTLDNGSTLHLVSSSRGACVLKITKGK